MIFLLELKSKKNTEIEGISECDFFCLMVVFLVCLVEVVHLYKYCFGVCFFFNLEHVQGHQFQRRD